jgi:GAF domain-containing protein
VSIDDRSRRGPTRGAREPLDLATAYAELHRLLLEGPEVLALLEKLAALAVAVVPGTHCGITMGRERDVAQVVGSDEVAVRMDELQYLEGRGPCLEAMRTGRLVHVPDVAADERWGGYREHAQALGVRSVLALPLVVDGESLGALNLFGERAGSFDEAATARAEAFTDQAATTLTILLRQSSRISLDTQLREALATRALIDQALGILMYSKKITSREAFEILRHASQTSNRKVSLIAADLISSMTGHAPEPPRPLSER